MWVYPKPLEIGDNEGFSTGKDLFGKSALASGMSNLVSMVEDPLVIAFDGQWGSGKTTFLKMWAGELRKSGHPVIFFDAFENDYVEDAFAALAREIVELAENQTSAKSQVAQTIKEKATHLGALLVRGTAKVGMKVAVRAATAGLASSDDFKDIGEDIGKEVEDAAEAYMEQLLDQPRKQKEIAESFRTALAKLPGLLAPPAEGEKQKPLVFIIDELDRCKPYFALALLERIKHFMAVQNVHFVLGVHLTQLQSSVRYAYGNDINAAAYLQKFISFTILNIEGVEDRRRSDLHKYAEHLAKNLAIRSNQESPLEASTDTIIRLIQYEQMSYRTLERAFAVLALAIGLTPEKYIQLGAIMGGLIGMKLLRPDLFKKAKQGALKLEEVREFLRFPPDEHRESEMGWEEQWWTFLLHADPLPEELREFGKSLSFRYNFRNRADIVKHTANNVIDRLSAD
ncbi:KAP P-loop domain-containing protein [Rhizobium sp. N541]|uniref:KAP family P-loop NTPase fold protein n=1 Tax=unclassified Rhizobium TaxID=2613769 RepID=UPI0007EE4670|nr:MULTISPECIES: P-loop NTPase fold protein [unclassified Rhizobium]ANM16334.1 KAP P-loop domain-containing protein [Rhizobium sp. N541]ANM22719.1 KAP P-loop domain-containing protein [Rhizobium sp. N941]